jgi:carboxyl-terminal processing protease
LGLFVFLLIHTTTLPAESLSSSNDASISRLVNAIALIKDDYAEPISDKKILENAMRGMVSGLDPHSEYLDEEAYKALLTTTSGEFGGLGIEVSTQYGVLKVIAPIDDTPAAKAGIKSGDFIVALNNHLVIDMSPNQAVDTMRGKKGTAILLTIIRQGAEKPLQFNLIRDIIHIDSIKSKMLDDGFGYVRISQFQQPTATLLEDAINKLKKESGGNLKGLILDLRNNPGGLLETAVSVTNLFLESDTLHQYNKLIVYTEGRVPEAKFSASANGHDILKAAPLLILMNSGSASASEIVAGALQDYHRAMIVGTPSFGKGSVQTVIPLDATHAVKLTTALYHTPAGHLIQNKGVIPDIYINEEKINPNNDIDSSDSYKEFQLKNHLENSANPQNPPVNNQKLIALAQEDFQLYEALNILKSIYISTQTKP